MTVEVPEGQDVLRAAIGAGVPLANSCGGEGECKACRIEVLAGADHLSAVDLRERHALDAARCTPQERLACAARVLGNVTVTTSYW